MTDDDDERRHSSEVLRYYRKSPCAPRDEGGKRAAAHGGITADAKTIEVGGECIDTTGGCSQGACVAVAVGLRALVNVLATLDAHETAKPACVGT